MVILKPLPKNGVLLVKLAVDFVNFLQEALLRTDQTCLLRIMI